MISTRPKRLKAMGIFIVVSLLVYGAFRLIITQLIAAEYAQLEDEGSPTTLSQLNASYPAPEEADNAASEYLKIFADLKLSDYNGVSTTFYGKMLKEPLEGPIAPELVAAAVAHLEKYPNRVTRLRHATNFPNCRFPVDYRTCLYGDSDVGHLTGLAYAARLLQTQILLDLNNNNAADAVRNFERTIQLTKAMDREPSFSAYYVRMTILTSLGGITNRMINRATFTPGTLERMAAMFSERLTSSNLSHALDGERCVGTVRFLAPLGRENALISDATKVAPFFTIPLYGDHSDIQLLAYLRSFTEFRAASQEFGANRLVSNGQNSISDAKLPKLRMIHQCQADLTAAIQIAEIGLRLEAQFLRGTPYPKKLNTNMTSRNSLIDPFADGGKKYGYVIGNDETRIYSVGRDGVDDGGTEIFYIDGLAGHRYGDVSFVKKHLPNKSLQDDEDL